MAITTRTGISTNIGKGLGFLSPYVLTSTQAITAAAAASGFLTTQLSYNTIGSTVPSTIVGMQLPPSLPTNLHSVFSSNIISVAARGAWLVYLYKMGTVSLTATGNQFTADSATFPITRTQFGVATSALTLTPLLYLTTATATTAPAFIIRNNSGPASGYVNQDGTSITGTITFTFPAAATAINSAFILRLEDGDSGVQKITQIDVQTAGSAGAGSIYGVEFLMPLPALIPDKSTINNSIAGLFCPNDLSPGVATSGTATAYLAIVCFGSTGANPVACLIQGVINT